MKVILSAIVLSLVFAANLFAGHQECLEATVRISNGVSRGSGCVFAKENGNLFILTNRHVAGDRGNRVGIEFWRGGHQSTKVRGIVIASYFRYSYHRDIAIVWVQESALGGYSPPAIPLAHPKDAIFVHGIKSAGCPNATWPTAWTGHVLRHSTGSGDVVYFVPQPAPGRSGSAMFDSRGEKIVGLIAWRSDSGTRDGSSDRDGYGIAMTHREIWAAIRGVKVSDGVMPANHLPIQTIIIPHQAAGHCSHGVPFIDDCDT